MRDLAIGGVVSIWATCMLAVNARAHGDETPDAGAAATVSAESQLAAAAIRLPEGFSVAPVASEPQMANPVAFCFDPQGRIFVAETHRVGKGVEDNRHHMDWLDDDLAARTVEQRREYMVRRTGDQIGLYTERSDQVRMLEDRDGDGRYEHSSIFSDGFNNVEDGAAAGVMWLGDRLLFTCIPSLWELRDSDGDGQAEHKRSLAAGFGVHVALFGHDLHGLVHGPDGKVYFSIGDRGLHVETPEGRVLSNPDSGAVLRCNPDGSHLELFATGLRNPQELAFNEYGDLFTVDNNSDSGDRARLVHIVEGMDAGWRMSYQYLHDRGPFNREKIWHTQNDEQPASIVPPLAHISDGPSGLVRYPGTGMPAAHDGAFFLADFLGTAGSSGILEFWIEPSGATYRLAKEEMFAEGVLATDCDFGPDGALYIADWIDGWGGTGSGRIHRVVSDEAESVEQRRATQETLQRMAKAGAADLQKLLGHADMRVRLEAQRQLVARGPSSSVLLVEAASNSASDLLGRLHAIWALGELSETDARLLESVAKLCGDPESEVRAQAARTLGGGDDADETRRRAWSDVLVPLLADSSPRVRAYAAIALGKLQHRDALAGLLKVAAENNDQDPVLRHAAAMGLAGSQPAEALVAAARGAGESERLALAIALGRQKSPLVAELLRDDSERVRTEAARVIWDGPIDAAYESLATALDSVSSANEPMLRRSLAANQAIGTNDQMEAVVDCGLRSDLSPAMREHAWQLVRGWASPSPRDPVHGLWRPLPKRQRESVVSSLQAMLPKLIDAGPHGRRGLVVAAELGVRDAYRLMPDVVADAAQPPELRARAVAAIETADEPVVTQAIDLGLKSSEPAVRSAARQLLIQRFPERAIDQLREAIDSATMRERQAALTMLAKLDVPAAREAIGQWMDRLENGECPPELQLEVLDAASQSADEALVERHKRYTQRLAGDDPLGQYSTSLLGGDAEVGRQIYEANTALACRRCHSTDPGEKLVGPNLADVGLRLPRNELLESIVKPNAKIAEGFRTTVLQLDTGKVVSGILRHEDETQVLLVDAEGKQFAVDAATIEDRFEGLSAMPEDLVKQITPRELRDLVEFLSQLRTPAESGHGATAPAASGDAGHGQKAD